MRRSILFSEHVMATYAVTTSDDDNWGDSGDRFKTRSPADQRLREKFAVGRHTLSHAGQTTASALGHFPEKINELNRWRVLTSLKWG